MNRIKEVKTITVRTIATICSCLVVVNAICFGCGSRKAQGIEVKKEQITENVQATEDFVETFELTVKRATQEAVQSQTPTGKVNDNENEAASTEVVVYVCGAVNNPGVYTLNGAPRMKDAVEAAGGMNEQADQNVLNLAQYISDGQMIRIPAIGEVTDTQDWVVQQSSGDGQNKTNPSSDSLGNSSGSNRSDGSWGNVEDNSDDKVDLNSADIKELMTIPGVGQAKAEAIIQYREEHGRFEKVEDIMQVSGIKEGSFAKMEPYICVK